jgi:hypothetical protein
MLKILSPLITLLLALSVIVPYSSLVAQNAPDISNLRTSIKANTQRLVFDITGEKDPAYYVKKDKNTLNVTLEAKLNTLKEDEFIKKIDKSKYISSIEFLTLPDENETIISIALNSGVKEDVFSLPSPSRVVIDLKK